MLMNYQDLEIWKLANDLVILIHNMTRTELPSFEDHETGSQIRRSMKSVKSNIAEGYGRRQYKQEFIHFLIIALASNDETTDHLTTLFQTGSLNNKESYELIRSRLIILGKKINLFIQAVKRSHHT
jgi:four helix bundle protein